MTAAQRQRVRQLFEAAFDQEPTDRAAWVTREAADDPIVRDEIVAIHSGSIVEYFEGRRRDATIGGYSMEEEPGFLLCPGSVDDVNAVALFMNHSCDPNVGLRGQMTFVAIRDVPVGEELPHHGGCAAGVAVVGARDHHEARLICFAVKA